MCSYNRVNGSYGCQNSKLLNGILKDELGFQGYGIPAQQYEVSSCILTFSQWSRIGVRPMRVLAPFLQALT